MLIAFANTPEELRKELIAMLEWRVKVESNNLFRMTTKRETARLDGRRAALQEFLHDLKTIAIEPKP